MRIHRGKLLAWSEKMELMSWTSCVSSNWLWHPHVFLLSSLGSKKAGAAKRSLRIYDQTFRWDSCRVFMCSTNRSIVAGALAWNGWFYIQLGSNRYSATPYDKDRKNAVGIWKTLAKLNIRSSKFARGQTMLLAPPRLIYNFASWGKWNVPTPVALLDDIFCLIEAS